MEVAGRCVNRLPLLQALQVKRLLDTGRSFRPHQAAAAAFSGAVDRAVSWTVTRPVTMRL
jgi:hypothetical protein